MPFRCADSIDTARIVRQTGDSAPVRVAELLPAAVVVAFAFDRLTANLVVLRIAEESALARADCDVVVRAAFCVAPAEN